MLTNLEIEEFQKKGIIKINPFDPEKLEANHYRLSVESIKVIETDDIGVVEIYDKNLDEQYHPLESKQYVIVRIKETSQLGRGMFGEFYPASLNIENGLILNCGRLNSYYDKAIHFGLFNAGPYEFALKKGYEVARIQFNYIADRPIDYNRPNYNSEYISKINEIRDLEERAQKLRNDLK